MKKILIIITIAAAAILLIAAVTNPSEEKHQQAVASSLSKEIKSMDDGDDFLSSLFDRDNFGSSDSPFENIDEGALESFFESIDEDVLASLFEDALKGDVDKIIHTAATLLIERRSFLFFSLPTIKIINKSVGVGAFGGVWVPGNMIALAGKADTKTKR